MFWYLSENIESNQFSCRILGLKLFLITRSMVVFGTKKQNAQNRRFAARINGNLGHLTTTALLTIEKNLETKFCKVCENFHKF